MPREQPVAGVAIRYPSQWMILAVVIESPGHAYQIGLRYDDRFGSFLPVSKTSVYGALDRLTHNGLTAPRTSSSRDLREMRVIYEATPAGHAAHRRWLLSPVSRRHWREELLGRIATSGRLGPDELLKLIDLYEQSLTAQATQIDHQEAIDVNPDEGVPALANRLALQEQAQVAAAQHVWVETSRQLLHEATT